VSSGQRFGNFPADAQHLSQRQLVAAFQPFVERFALEELHGEEGNAAFLIDLVNADNVIVLDGGHGLGLAQKSLAGAGAGGQSGKHRLDSDGAFELGVLGLEDDAHSPSAEFLKNPVVGNVLADHAVGGLLQAQLSY
jgi:hypothetical protein